MSIRSDFLNIVFVYNDAIHSVYKCVEETIHNGGAGIIHRETSRGEQKFSDIGPFY